MLPPSLRSFLSAAKGENGILPRACIPSLSQVTTSAWSSSSRSKVDKAAKIGITNLSLHSHLHDLRLSPELTTEPAGRSGMPHDTIVPNLTGVDDSANLYRHISQSPSCADLETVTFVLHVPASAIGAAGGGGGAERRTALLSLSESAGLQVKQFALYRSFWEHTRWCDPSAECECCEASRPKLRCELVVDLAGKGGLDGVVHELGSGKLPIRGEDLGLWLDAQMDVMDYRNVLVRRLHQEVTA